jgi:cytochrome c553
MGALLSVRARCSLWACPTEQRAVIRGCAAESRVVAAGLVESSPVYCGALIHFCGISALTPVVVLHHHYESTMRNASANNRFTCLSGRTTSMTKPMKTLARLCMTLAACALSSSVVRAADGPPEFGRATRELAEKTCANCHGVSGRSISPTFPNLAAQTAPYLQAQLHAFRDQTRADPDALSYMWGMAAQLSDVDKGKGINIFRRGADEKWRVAIDEWSSDIPIAR